MDPAEQPLPPDRKAKQRKRKKKGVIPGVNPKTGFDMRTEAYKLVGVDVTQIPGLIDHGRSRTGLLILDKVGMVLRPWSGTGTVQRNRPEHVKVAHCGRIRLVAWVVPG